MPATESSLALALAVFLGSFAPPLGAQELTATFEPVADTYLRRGTPNVSYGTVPILEIKSAPSNNRVLVRFDLAAVAATLGQGTLISAELELSVESNGGGWGTSGRAVDLHRVSVPWSEAGATWYCATDAVPMNNHPDCSPGWGGGNVEPEVVATALHTNDLLGPVRFDLTQEVAALVAGGEHLGWSIERGAGAGTIFYASREGTPGRGPRLIVSYEPADRGAPIIGIGQPLEPVVRQQPLTILIGYYDGEQGLDLSTFRARIDGNDLSDACSVEPTRATCSVNAVEAGLHTIDVEIRDLAGNSASAQRDFSFVTSQGPQQVGLVAHADTYLASDRPVDPHGAASGLELGINDTRRVLVVFDRIHVLRAIAAGILTRARLELFVESNGGGWGNEGLVSIHRLLEEWVESDANWSCSHGIGFRSDGQPCAPRWDGGRFAASPADIASYTDATLGWVSFDVTADVQGMLTGSSHEGWLVKAGSETTGKLVYGSRESAEGHAPRLVLEFEAMSEPDHTPPQARLLFPASGTIVGEPSQHIIVEYFDLASGLDLATLEIVFDGEPRRPDCMVGTFSAYCELGDLPAGMHAIAVAIEDTAGNRATLDSSFEIVLDVTRPVVVVTHPAEGTLLNQPVLEIRGSVSDESEISSLLIQHEAVASEDGLFSGLVELNEGSNALEVEAIDAIGNRAVVRRNVILDTRSPEVRLLPALPSSQVTSSPSLTLAGDARDPNGIAEVLLNGNPLDLDAGHFATEIPLQEGRNTLLLEARDRAGNLTSATFEVIRFTAPELTITEPAPLTLTAADTVQVSGTVSAGATVTVEGVAATVVGNSFSATDVPLHEGSNVLSAVATDSAGRTAIASVPVFRDQTPPRVVITHPADGDRITGSSVTVTGLVIDPLGGIDPAIPVTVNGVTATVMNGAFVAVDVPLSAGDNLLETVAADAVGNHAQARVRVEQRGVPGGRIEVISGNHQTAVVGSPLAEPLVARVTDAAGDSVSGAVVLFSLRGNNGNFENGRRRLASTTDADGLARASFRLGTRAGAGEQVAEAVASGFVGPATFYVNALPAAAARIFVDAGDQQVGCPGQPLPSPFVVVVTDTFFNRVAGVAATFRVVSGGGFFGNGQPELTLITDAAGQASTILTAGRSEGIANNVVRVELADAPGGDFASFVASTLAPLDPGQTAISGLVLDNTDRPIPGATVLLEGTPLVTQTDANGFFHLQPAPVGTVHMVVEGSTALRPGPWPTLGFVMVTVPGRDNHMGRPIPLVQLNERGVVVDETRGGTVTLPDVPGFALEIAPGSVTFPDGSRSGEVVVTVVHNDKVPMVPNFGQQPRFVITIQPTNAVFDPPARLTMPNLDGLEPGRVTEMYSFDHDAGRFVSLGTGTVSDDGTVIVSDPGVGLIKAGWHCGGDPASSGTPHACPYCQECDGARCAPIGEALSAVQLKQVQQNCDDGNDCTDDFCREGGCLHDPLHDTPCGDDGDPCTIDVCDNGTCTHPVMMCMECTRCDGGNCVADPMQDRNQCMDEGDPSCSIDRCQNGNCNHTPLMGVTPYGPPDPPGLDIPGLDDPTERALECLEQAVANVGGNLVVSSAFRPQAYQDHLREVWDRHQDYVAAGAQNYAEAECDLVIDSIEDEWNVHDLVARPARVSNHSQGNAFDARAHNLPPTEDIDCLAAGCGLNRPHPNQDPVHFEH